MTIHCFQPTLTLVELNNWLHDSMLKNRVYSQYSKKAAVLLGEMIHLYRKKRKWSAQDLSDRAGISRTTLRKIEKGDMKCEIGIVFEVATLVGISLFDLDSNALDSLTSYTKDKISLLPKSVRVSKESIDDDF